MKELEIKKIEKRIGKKKSLVIHRKAEERAQKIMDAFEKGKKKLEII
jgi:hypothetical protein